MSTCDGCLECGFTQRGDAGSEEIGTASMEECAAEGPKWGGVDHERFPSILQPGVKPQESARKSGVGGRRARKVRNPPPGSGAVSIVTTGCA
jgi:hypothetical protein